MGEEPITATIDKFVDAGSLAGAATLVWQDGKVIQTAGVGWRDIEGSSCQLRGIHYSAHRLNDKADYIYAGAYVI